MNITISNEDPSLELFNKLVQLAARAFYDDVGIGQDRSVKRQATESENRGIAVVVLDALTRWQWVTDEDLAKKLKIYKTLIRNILQFLVKEKFVEQYDRKETVTRSYYRLDYAQIYDVVRYKIHRMKKTLKDELEPKHTIQKYICPNCGKRFNALDAPWLVSTDDVDFHCESCLGVLAVDSDMIANQDLGDGDANAESSRKNKNVMLQKIEVQLKPLTDHIAFLKDLKAPDFGSLQTWEAKANAAASTENKNETKDQVDVSLFGTANEPNKKLPIPWMTKQSGSLSGEQHGEEMQESKMEGSSKSIGPSDDKKSAAEIDESERLRQEAYYQSYYTELYKRQQEEAAASSANTSTPIDLSSTRQVGMKSKLEEGDDDDDEWEDGTPAGNVDELNLQDDAKPSKEGDEDEDMDWEDR